MVNKKVGEKFSMRKDFEVFGKGVERLEELRIELNGLKSGGYEAEVASIRGKLKNVSEIPVIEKRLRVLKSKISGKYKVKKRVGKSKVDLEMKALRQEIVRKTVAVKSAATRSNQKIAKQIPQIKSQLAELRAELGKRKQEEERKREMLKRIDPSIDLMANEAFGLSLNEIKSELSDRIKNKEAAIQKRLGEDLEMREKVFKKRYGEMEAKQHRLYAERVAKHLKREVQGKFNVLLKRELKRKKAVLSRKELGILKAGAKKEFEIGKEKLRKKLVRDLASEKVKMRRHFEEESLLHKYDLHREFEREIVKKVRELKKRHRARERVREIDVKKKIEELDRRLEGKMKLLDEKKEREARIRDELLKKRKELVEERKELENKERRLEGELREKVAVNLSDMKRASEKKLRIRMKSLSEKQKGEIRSLNEKRKVSVRILKEKRRVLEKEERGEQKKRKAFAEKQGVLREKNEVEKRKIEKLGKIKMQEIVLEEEKMRQRLEVEKDKEIHVAMRKRTEDLRGQFKKEFDERLEFELRKKDSELEQKKIAIEQEIQRKAKALFE